MVNRREIFEKKRLQIIKEFGGDRKIELSRALNNLLYQKKLQIKDYVRQIENQF